MNPKISELKKWGCDTESGLKRMLNDENFYLSLLSSLAREDMFITLGEELKNKNTAKAFECAHYLKGSISNMDITPMLANITNLVETLRSGSLENTAEVYEQLMAQYEKFKEIIEA